jgi:hypothetical protein
VSKKLKTIVTLDVENSDQDLKQSPNTNSPAQVQINDKELEGSELFSFFTANIIKEEKVFTR